MRSTDGRSWRAALSLICAVSLTLGACAWQSKPPPHQAITDEMNAMRQAIDQAVHDPQRAQRMQRSVNDMQAELLAFDSLYQRFGQSMRQLNADPATPRIELEAVFDRFDTERRTIRERLAASHLELLAASTDAEWDLLSSHEREALLAVKRARGD